MQRSKYAAGAEDITVYVCGMIEMTGGDMTLADHYDAEPTSYDVEVRFQHGSVIEVDHESEGLDIFGAILLAKQLARFYSCEIVEI